MVTPLAHGHRKFPQNVPEFHEGFCPKQGGLVGGTGQCHASLFVFAPGVGGQIPEIVKFLAAGIFKTCKKNATGWVQVVGGERFDEPIRKRLEV